MIEVLNSGLRDDFVSVVQVVGGLGAQLPLSKYKFLASSSGHAIYDMAKAGEITLPLNSSFFKAAVIPAKGSFTASISLTKVNSQVIGFGEEDTLKVKAAVIDGSNKVLKQLQDDGSGARFLTLPKGLPSAKKIRFTNPTSKRVVYSWAVVTKN